MPSRFWIVPFVSALVVLVTDADGKDVDVTQMNLGNV